MKAYRYLASIALSVALTCASPANAQVLGGNVNGALGGAVSGGAHGVDAMARGSIHGSIGADTDAVGSVRGRASNTVDGVERRTRQTAATTRERTEAAVEQAQDASVSVATSASATVRGTADGAAAGAVNSVSSAVEVAGSAQDSADLAVGVAGSAASSARTVSKLDGAMEEQPRNGRRPTAGLSANGALEGTTRTDSSSDGLSANAMSAQDAKADGSVRTKHADVEADARTSSSVEAGASTQR